MFDFGSFVSIFLKGPINFLPSMTSQLTNDDDVKHFFTLFTLMHADNTIVQAENSGAQIIYIYIELKAM